MSENVNDYELVARTIDVPKRRGIVRIVNEHEIAIFQVNGNYYAVSNICPHQHSPVLADGLLEENIITCPMHGWSYCVDTGKSIRGGGGLHCYEIKIEGENIFIKRPKNPPQPSW